METKSIVIFGMGVIAGYLLTNYMNSMKASPTPMPPNMGGGTSPGQSLGDYCENEWIKMSSAMRFSSEEGAAMAKEEFMRDCLNPTPINIENMPRPVM